MDDEQLEEWAHARAKQLRDFYTHVGIYAVAMAFLLLLNSITRGSDGSWWVIWPALGWGIAVAINAVAVLIGGAGKVDTWEERKVEELVRKEKERTKV